MDAADPPFTGVGVALVTLFDADGELDAEATARHAGHLVDRGVRGVLVAGSTGEAAALDADERSRLLVAVRDAVDGRVPVIAGTGAPSARQAVALSRQAADDGADALLALSPPATDDPRPYYDAIATAVDAPLLAYHYPARSAPGIPVDLVCELPVVGIKDSTGDPVRLAIEIDQTRSRRLHRAAPPWRCRPRRWAPPGPSSRWPTSTPRAAPRRGRATAPASASSSTGTARVP